MDTARELWKKLKPLERATFINAAFLAVILLARQLMGEGIWLGKLLAYSPIVVTLVPSFMITCLCLPKKSMRIAGINLALIITGAVVLAGFQVKMPKQASGKTLTMLTWNLYYGRGGEDVAALAQRSKADIIFLQETHGWERLGLADLMHSSQFKGWHALSHRTLVILSRYSLKKVGEIEWNGLVVDCSVGGQKIRLINIHPPILYHPKDLISPEPIKKNTEDRERLFYKVQEAIPWDTPVILAGDFNTPPGTEIYRKLSSQLQNAFERRGTGFGFTYPHPVPLVRIDHIFTGNGCSPVSVRTFSSPSSNHRALCAVLRVSNG